MKGAVHSTFNNNSCNNYNFDPSGTPCWAFFGPINCNTLITYNKDRTINSEFKGTLPVAAHGLG
jgi:hypothetical protein